MIAARLLLVGVAVVGLSYLVLAKRRHDFWTVSFLASCLYFLPGFVGFTNYPAPPGLNSDILRIPLEMETYLVMAAVLWGLIMGTMIFDFLSGRRGPARGGSDPLPEIGIVLAGAASLGVILSFMAKGSALFSPQKRLIMESSGSQWHTLWTVASLLLAVNAFERRRWKLLGLAGAYLMFDMYVGFRSTTACAIVAIAVLYMFRKGAVRLVARWKEGVTVASLVVFVLAYKHVYRLVKAANWTTLGARVSGGDFLDRVFLRSEPFMTQTVLNEVIRLRYETPIEDLRFVLNNFLLFSQHLGVDVVPFNRKFQEYAFSYVPGGIGSNIWAEMWSSGGWGLLLLFIIIYAGVIGFGNWLLLRSTGSFRALIAALLSYWSFYIHRNTLGFQLTLERRLVILWGLAALVALFLHWVIHVKVALRKRSGLVRESRT